MHRIILSLILAFNAVLSVAQSATIRGTVLKDGTKESLPGVVVRLSDVIGTTTNLDGQYSLSAPNGVYTIVFSLVGYQEYEKQIELISGQSTELNISLKEVGNSLDVVVVSAGKFEQKLGEVTMSMEVLNPELVQEKNAITADEALQQAPGVSIVDGEPQIRSGSGYSFGAGSRVQVLVDDLPVLSGDAGRPAWGFMPLENLSQIEIIKGASSVLYGSAALSGAINFRTAFPSDTSKTVVSVFYGVYSDPKSDSSKYWSSNLMRTGVNFLHSQKMGQLDLVVGGSYLGDDGHLGPIKDSATGSFDNKFNPLTSDRYSSTNRIRVNMNLRYRSKKVEGLAYGLNTNWTQGNSLATLLWENSKTGLYGAFQGSATRTIQLLGTVDPFVTYYSKSGTRHSLKGRWQSLDNENDNNQGNFSDVYYGEYQFQKKWSGALKNLTSTMGAVMIHTNARGQLFTGGNPDGRNTANNYALFLQLDKQFFTRLNVSTGVRYEYFEINGQSASKPVFRAGLNYQLARATYLRSSFGQGFRFPSIAEKFIVTGVGSINIFANPDLVPETSYNMEIGIKQGFKIGNFKGYADFAIFRQEYENFIEFTFGQWKYVQPLQGPLDFPRFQNDVTKSIGFKSVNTGKARIQGAEFSLMGEGKIGNVKLQVLGGYTYTKPISLTPDYSYGVPPNGAEASFKIPGSYTYSTTSSDTSNNILKYRLQHLVRMDIASYWKNFSLGISLRYNSHMQNIDRAFEDLETIPVANFNPGIRDWRQSHTTGDYIFDLRMGYEIKGRHKIALVINNLLNREYAIRPLAIEEPRVSVIQYTLKF